MKPEITFQNFELERNKIHIGDIIERYQHFFPSWLHELTVTIYDNLADDQPKATIAWSKSYPEYGSGSIFILSKLLDRPEREQHSFILHEMLHIAHRREYNFIWDRLLNPVKDRNEELYDFLVEDYRERNEEFIEGLTRSLLLEHYKGD